MIQVFLSYARADGLEAAARLRAELGLGGMGFAVWRDIEEMRGGLAWRKQLFQALSQVDAVLVLLTPGAVASQNVAWEWQNALIMDKRVIPLLVCPCEAPAELKSLHYHRLDDPTGYTLGLARLARDLMALAVGTSDRAVVAEPGDQITVAGKDNIVAARYATVIKESGGATLDAAAVAQILATLRSQSTDGLSVEQMAELRGILSGLQGQVQGVAQGIDDLKAGQARILARFDESEQRILSPILDRLDSQQAEQTDAILDALETRIFPAGELGRHLATIQMALADINLRSAQISDLQLAQSARQVAELATAPDLDVKHKLKLTVPIIPVFLSYEGAFELGSRLNLEEAWRALREWIGGR